MSFAGRSGGIRQQGAGGGFTGYKPASGTLSSNIASRLSTSDSNGSHNRHPAGAPGSAAARNRKPGSVDVKVSAQQWKHIDVNHLLPWLQKKSKSGFGVLHVEHQANSIIVTVPSQVDANALCRVNNFTYANQVLNVVQISAAAAGAVQR